MTGNLPPYFTDLIVSDVELYEHLQLVWQVYETTQEYHESLSHAVLLGRIRSRLRSFCMYLTYALLNHYPANQSRYQLFTQLLVSWPSGFLRIGEVTAVEREVLYSYVQEHELSGESYYDRSF